MKTERYLYWLLKMTTVLYATVCAFVAFSALGNSTNLTNRSEPLKSFETYGSDGQFVIVCDEKDIVCKRDNISLEAVYEIHRLIDDDQNGNVDQSESDEFMRDELQYKDGSNERLSIFHGNDKLISVEDLWHAWKKSQVYNWTIEEVTEWLSKHVELGQYVSTFQQAKIDGTMLPSIAIQNNNFTKNVLKIKNAIHRQKISVKAMDLILFGPPKEKHNFVKDLILMTSLVTALVGCGIAYTFHKSSKVQMKKVMEEMENLQKAEDSLMELQEKLNTAEEKQKSAYQEKETLEMRYQDEIDLAKREAEKLRKEREAGKQEENSALTLAERELEQVRAALRRAEKELGKKVHSVPPELQEWLQLTYETEQMYFNIHKREAEKQLEQAREECRRIQKKRGALFGPLRMAPTNSIDQFDNKIESARQALDEVRKCLTEKSQRWHNIEMLCGFPIINNPGKEHLIQTLFLDTSTGGNNFSTALGSLNVDEAELDEDPQYAMYYSSTMSNGYSRPSLYTGYNMQVRQRPKALVGSSSSLVRVGFSGSTNSLGRPGHVNSRMAESPVSPLSETTSVISDSDRPLFSLDESSSESPSSSEMDKSTDLTLTRTEDSDSDSKGTRYSHPPITNGGGIVNRPRSGTHETDKESGGNFTLPPSTRLITQNSSPTLMPKSQSELNIKKLMLKSVSLENGKSEENERLENKKKRHQFLKLFKKKKA
ncbi:stromal interaction molecule 1-like isoform X2 [Saccostrea echinata]|uniref:stromal interaction molecule 1-like isoform X2 n=1 Tax=Saccostrea echinata TaxID=191078 RepID=UPI002A8315A4|nr:stromal interaction molecule 1-like isoform X2 [Saccostrea echinata]